MGIFAVENGRDEANAGWRTLHEGAGGAIPGHRSLHGFADVANEGWRMLHHRAGGAFAGHRTLHGMAMSLSRAGGRSTAAPMSLMRAGGRYTMWQARLSWAVGCSTAGQAGLTRADGRSEMFKLFLLWLKVMLGSTGMTGPGGRDGGAGRSASCFAGRSFRSTTCIFRPSRGGGDMTRRVTAGTWRWSATCRPRGSG